MYWETLLRVSDYQYCLKTWTRFRVEKFPSVVFGAPLHQQQSQRSNAIASATITSDSSPTNYHPNNGHHSPLRRYYLRGSPNTFTQTHHFLYESTHVHDYSHTHIHRHYTRYLASLFTFSVSLLFLLVAYIDVYSMLVRSSAHVNTKITRLDNNAYKATTSIHWSAKNQKIIKNSPFERRVQCTPFVTTMGLKNLFTWIEGTHCAARSV